METQASARRDLETALIEKCWKDPDFKKAVISDPRGMLEQRTGRKLPPNLKIFVHEEDANTLHLTIPPAPANLTELSDDDLERVAGGTEVVYAVSAIVAVVTGVAVSGGVTAGVATGMVKGGW